MIRMIESFDAGDSFGKWDTATGELAVGSYGGTNNSGRLRNDTSNLKKTFDNQATWIVGFRFKTTKTYQFSTRICDITLSGTSHIYVGQDTSGQFYVVCPAGTYIDTGNVLAVDTWVYVELKVTIHNTTGSFEVRLNGESRSLLTQSNIDTQNGGTAAANRIDFQGVADSLNNNYIFLDDIYIADGQTGTGQASDFVGDVKIAVLLPNAEGALSDFTPSTGTDNSANIDEETPDSDTTYNSSSTVGHHDSFAFGALPAGTAAVRAVQIVTTAKKDDAGTRGFKNLVRHGGSNYYGSEKFLGTGYQTFFDCFDANPGTSAEWTPAQVNTDDEFGYEITT